MAAVGVRRLPWRQHHCANRVKDPVVDVCGITAAPAASKEAVVDGAATPTHTHRDKDPLIGVCGNTLLLLLCGGRAREHRHPHCVKRPLRDRFVVDGHNCTVEQLW
jgi:hypothetical protein